MKCKPGDLAVIISDPDERNIGGFVEVVRRAAANEFTGPNDWACRAISPLFGSSYPVPSGETCGIDDQDLMPIRGGSKRCVMDAFVKKQQPEFA